MASVLNEDVLEDLFETNMKNNARLCKQGDVSCFQSTQVSRADVPEGTVVIKPDFPLSPLQCAAPAVSASSDSIAVFTSPRIHHAGGLCSEAEMLTVTAAQSRPTTTVINCTEVHLVSSQSADVTFPSVVYDRVRNLFCTSDNEINPNSLSNRLPCSTASDTRQQNRHDDKLVTEADEVICTTAVSCSGDSSPLESSYMDAGRMAYAESDVNVLAKVSVANAADVLVMTSCINSSISDLRIENVCSLRNNVDTAISPDVTQSLQSPCQETYVKRSLFSDSGKHAQQKKSPADKFIDLGPLSGSKRKRFLHKEKNRESDVLFKKAKKTKFTAKKRRLYKHDMLMEERMEEHPQRLCTSDSVDAHTHAGKSDVKMVRNDNLSDCEIATVVSGQEILPTTFVAAGDSAPPLVTGNCSKTRNNPPVDAINNVIASRQNSVEVTGVESDEIQVALLTKTVTSLNMPVVVVNKKSHISLAKQTNDVKRDRGVVAETSCEIETESDAAAVVSTSAVSQPVPIDGLSTVSRSVANVSVLNPAVRVVSAEWPRSVNYPCSNQILTGEKRPSSCMIDELLANTETRIDIAAAKNFEPEVSDEDSHLHATEMCGKDSVVTKHAVDTETSEMLPAAASDSNHSSLIRRDDSTIGRSSPLYPSSDAVPASCQRDAAETSEAPVDGVVSLPTDDDTDVAHQSRLQSKSLKEFGCQSSCGSTDLKSVSSDNTVDLLPCNSAVNDTGKTKDRDVDWHSENRKRNLSQKKFQRLTSMTRRARTSVTDHNKNVVTVRDDMSDHRCLTSETPCGDNTSSAAGSCVPSQNTDESSSQSLLCGQRQLSGSYCLSNIAASECRCSAVGTPFLRSHLCSLQCRERCLVAEESLGYRPPSTKADDTALCIEGHEDQLMPSESRSATNLIAGLQLNTLSTCGEEQTAKVLPAVSGMSDVCTDAVVSGTETELKQLLSTTSNGSSKLTLPTPKNSLTCYQPVITSPSAAPVTETSLVLPASQVQPNYAVIQVLIYFQYIFSYFILNHQRIIIFISAVRLNFLTLVTLLILL